MIAAALALSSLDAGEYETVRVHTPAEFTSHWNPHEGQVLFWVDDAFGSIRHDRAATEGWARRLPELIAAVEGGAKVVMTSRNYIYYEARPFLKEYELPLFVEKQVVVEVSELTVEEKQRILYNHLKNGDQPASVRAMMKPYLPELARDVAFRPEVARRLGRQIFTRNVNLYQSGLREYMARSAEFLCEIVGQLEPRHIAALALVYTQDFVPSPVAIDSASRMIAERVGVTVADIGEGFDALEGSLLRRAPIPGVEAGEGWSFHHPTIREGFASYVTKKANLVGIFLDGMSDEELFEKIDCGSNPTRGELIVIPPSLYGEVAARVAACRPRDKGGDSFHQYLSWINFLTHSCGLEFLRVYLDADDDLVETLLMFTSFLEAVSEPTLLARLYINKSLSEADRVRAVERVSVLALDTPDSAWLELSEWRVLLTSDERSALLERVRTELIPRLGTVIDSWVEDLPAGGTVDPASHLYNLEVSLYVYQRHFEGIQESQDALNVALDEVRDLIAGAIDQISDSDNSDREMLPKPLTLHRSLFDDIDD